MVSNKGRSLDWTKLKDRERFIISTKDALRDTEPYLTCEQMLEDARRNSMNLLEKYVTNITSVKEKTRQNDEWEYIVYEVVADTDCYGDKRKQETLLLLESEYKEILEKGYYLV